MSKVEVTIINDELVVKSKFNSDLLNYAKKKLNGKWNANKKKWIYPLANLEKVKEVYIKIYGEWEDTISSVIDRDALMKKKEKMLQEMEVQRQQTLREIAKIDYALAKDEKKEDNTVITLNNDTDKKKQDLGFEESHLIDTRHALDLDYGSEISLVELAFNTDASYDFKTNCDLAVSLLEYTDIDVTDLMKELKKYADANNIEFTGYGKGVGILDVKDVKNLGKVWQYIAESFIDERGRRDFACWTELDDDVRVNVKGYADALAAYNILINFLIKNR